jgi:hypothetical protein
MNEALDDWSVFILLLATSPEASPVNANRINLGMMELDHSKGLRNRVVERGKQELIRVNENTPTWFTMLVDVMLVRLKLARLRQ